MNSDAVIFEDVGKVRYGKVSIPEMGPDDVMVETKYSWISNGTESSFLRGERIDGIQPWKPGMARPFPMVPGYQRVGKIIDVGMNVSRFSKGQTVFVTLTHVNGMHFNYGGHVAVGPVHAEQAIALPDGLDPAAFSGLVLTQVGFNTGSRGEGGPNAAVVVMGDGMVGLWAAQTYQARGFRVALIGRHNDRLKKFKPGSNDVAFNSRDEQNWLTQVKNWANDGIQIVADTVGNDTNEAENSKLLQALNFGGHFIAAGHHGKNPTVDLAMLTTSELTLHCPCGWTRQRLQTTMDWIASGRLDTISLVTHRFSASRAEEAWNEIVNNREGTLGVIIEW